MTPLLVFDAPHMLQIKIEDGLDLIDSKSPLILWKVLKPTASASIRAKSLLRNA